MRVTVALSYVNTCHSPHTYTHTRTHSYWYSYLPTSLVQSLLKVSSTKPTPAARAAATNVTPPPSEDSATIASKESLIPERNVADESRTAKDTTTPSPPPPPITPTPSPVTVATGSNDTIIDAVTPTTASSVGSSHNASTTTTVAPSISTPPQPPPRKAGRGCRHSANPLMRNPFLAAQSPAKGASPDATAGTGSDGVEHASTSTQTPPTSTAPPHLADFPTKVVVERVEVAGDGTAKVISTIDVTPPEGYVPREHCSTRPPTCSDTY